MNIWNPVMFAAVVWGFKIELHLFGLLSLLVTLAVYPIYVLAMTRGKSSPPRSTWFLWLILDIVLFSAQMRRGIFDAMLFAFILGTALVAFFTIKYGASGWTRTETICSVVVALSIIIWAITGPLAAMICSLAGAAVSEYPLLKRVWAGKYESLPAWCTVILSTGLNWLDGQILVSSFFFVLQLLVVLPVFYYWKYIPKRRAKCFGRD